MVISPVKEQIFLDGKFQLKKSVIKQLAIVVCEYVEDTGEQHLTEREQKVEETI